MVPGYGGAGPGCFPGLCSGLCGTGCFAIEWRFSCYFSGAIFLALFFWGLVQGLAEVWSRSGGVGGAGLLDLGLRAVASPWLVPQEFPGDAFLKRFTYNMQFYLDTVHFFVPISLALMLAGLQFWFFRALARYAVRNERTVFLGNTLRAVCMPVTVLILLVGSRHQLENIITQHWEWDKRFDTVFELMALLLLLWLLLRMLHEGQGRVLVLLGRRREVTMRDKTNIGLLVKILQLLFVFLFFLGALQILGIHITSLLALGGVGGLVFGLAAKDLLSNFFGGAILYMDRPFEVGDWIRCPQHGVEGTVQHIGWRMTHILTFEKRFLYVPNSTFATTVVENPSRMLNRRIYEYVGVRYKDRDKITGLLDAVRKMLEEHPEIDPQQTIIVNLDRFSSSSLDFFIYVLTRTTDWVKYHQVKQDVMLRVLEIIEAHGAECPFPTTTVELGGKGVGSVPGAPFSRAIDLSKSPGPGE